MTDGAPKFRLRVDDVFRFTDGRTALAGVVEGGEEVIILPGQCTLMVNGQPRSTIEIEPEMLLTMDNVIARRDLRAVATHDQVELTADEIKTGKVTLEGPMTIHGHRHLLGIESPPNDFLPDSITMGPRLPEGWDGDAWVGPDGRDYFLRAWNKTTAEYAVSRAPRFEQARAQLLDEIRTRPRKVVIQLTESVG